VTGDAYERFRRDYAPVFLQYLSERGELGRRAAYELGRRAITEQLSVLDLTRIHHAMLLEVIRTHRTPRELEHIAQAASELLVEALAVFEMTQAGAPVTFGPHAAIRSIAPETAPRSTSSQPGQVVTEMTGGFRGAARQRPAARRGGPRRAAPPPQ
jgi:hypothetical protein